MNSQKVIQQTKQTHLFFGQQPPGNKPVLFAPGIISKSDRHEFGCTLSKDGAEFYFGVDNDGQMEIHYTILENGVWSDQENLFPGDSSSYNDPMLSKDESKLYFISNRSLDSDKKTKDIDIWYVEREGDRWSSPINAGPNVNNELDQYYASFSKDGSLYYASKDTAQDAKRYAFDIYRSQLDQGVFQVPVKLPPTINTERYEADVFVSPDESFMIFCSIRRGGLGIGDLYISFKDNNDQWTTARNMGDVINTEHHELCPFITSDGEYFFYTSNQDIYWVSTDVIRELKDAPKE